MALATRALRPSVLFSKHIGILTPGYQPRLHRPGCPLRAAQQESVVTSTTTPVSTSTAPQALSQAQPTPTTSQTLDATAQPAVDGARAGMSLDEWAAEIEELQKLVGLLPVSVRSALEEHPEMPELLEVVMDLGRPPLARFPSGDVKLSMQPVTDEDLMFAISQVGEFGGDNRAGIDRTLHRISCIRNRTGRVIGLTCRVGRAIKGSAEMVADLVTSGASILFLGRPGVGKTTAIREVCRLLGDDLVKRVVIVDTSNEIGGDGDIPHPGIGRARRMQVADPEAQHRVMIEAVENHMPEVIVIDEIGTQAECLAARTIAQRGVQLVATAHGNELENVIKNPSLSDLVGGIQSVTLGDEEAKRRGVQKSILERGGPPTFDVCVEMLERNKWKVHLDVGQAVDVLLAGGTPGGQVREKTHDGSLLKFQYNSTAPPGAAPVQPHTAAGTRGKVADVRSKSRQQQQQQQAAEAGSRGHESIDMDALEAGGSMVSTARSPFVRSAVPLSPASTSSDDDEDDEFGSRKAKKLQAKQLMSGVDPDSALLRVFPFELDTERLWEVMVAMQLSSKVLIAGSLAEADAVLGLRTRVRGCVELRRAAKDSGLPIYAVKNTSAAHLARAFRTLLGVDPAAGSAFSRGLPPELPAPSDPSYGSLDEDELFTLRDEVDGGLSKVRASRRTPLPYKAYAAEEALDEALLAIEQIVVPLQQPVELLPRVQEVLQAQIKLVERYKLGYEVIGAQGADARLRIMPQAKSAAAAAVTGGGDAAATL